MTHSVVYYFYFESQASIKLTSLQEKCHVMRTRRSRIVDVIVVVVVVSTILKNEPDLLNLEDNFFLFVCINKKERGACVRLNGQRIKIWWGLKVNRIENGSAFVDIAHEDFGMKIRECLQTTQKTITINRHFCRLFALFIDSDRHSGCCEFYWLVY